MARPLSVPCLFHPEQLGFAPEFEWALGERTVHPETRARAQGIVAAIEADPERFDLRPPDELPEHAILALHDEGLIRMLKTSATLQEGETFYPSVFMPAPEVEPNPDSIGHAGAFCFDTSTPLSRETWIAARWSAACAVSAAALVAEGDHPIAYALSRPPGHHATAARFGGYCYLANSALAASHLRARGARVCVLDIDVHHGNGTQSVFWNEPDVLTVSVHGDPNTSFPFLTGFASEVGGEAARGANLNLPLPRGTDGQAYERGLELALDRIRTFAPDFLVLAAGVDTYEHDPIGSFGLTTADLHRVGELIGALGLRTAVVQEGGYHTSHIGRNVTAVLLGLCEGRS